MGFAGLVEPLRGLFKDEVRALGRQLGLPETLVSRQPFPGPGLAIRVIGEVTSDKLDILREADAIFREEMKRSRVRADQYFAVLTNSRSVGVVGDFRTYNYTVALRAVRTTDFMTCEYAPLSHKLLGRVSSRIVNEVRGVGRVVYDITGKPPATIEWELYRSVRMYLKAAQPGGVRPGTSIKPVLRLRRNKYQRGVKKPF